MKINGYDFLIGADPEIFVADRYDRPVSAFGLVPGDKDKPLKVKKGAVQVDGMALEFNIDPAKNEEEFLSHLETVMDTLKGMVPGYKFYDKPVAHFGKDYIAAQPLKAKILGCEPDYNAYTGQVNPRPDAETPFRTAAGHIHIGWTNGVNPLDPGHFEACCMLTKMLDITIGLPSLLWDDDAMRRKLYGQAGAFRPKHYGMEYRTPSNRWLRADKPYLRKAVYQGAIKAITDLMKDNDLAKQKIMGKTAQEIINTNDVESVAIEASHGTAFIRPSLYRAA